MPQNINDAGRGHKLYVGVVGAEPAVDDLAYLEGTVAKCEGFRQGIAVVAGGKNGSVAKKYPMMPYSIEGKLLNGNTKQIFDESYLPFDILFANLFNLSFPNHVHCLIPSECLPSRLK